MWDDPGTHEGIGVLEVSRGQVQLALGRARDAGDRAARAGRVGDAVDAAASAVPGGELALALADVGVELVSRVRALRHAVESWTREAEAAMAAYDGTDGQARERLSRTSWEPV